MSETNWTTGVWCKNGWSIVDRANQTVICNVLPWDVSGDQQEDTANANLIASAPDLYDALLESHTVMKNDIYNYTCSSVCRRNEAILAKARGEIP